MFRKLLNYLLVIPFKFKKNKKNDLLTSFNVTYHLDEFAEKTTIVLRTWIKNNSHLKQFEEIDKLELHCIMKDQIDEHFPKHCNILLDIEFISDPYYNPYTTKIHNCVIVKTEFKHPLLEDTDHIYMYWIMSLHTLQVNKYKYCFLK